MIVEKKQVPTWKILQNYVIAYNQILSGLDPQDQEEIIWFTCKVIPAVENWLETISK